MINGAHSIIYSKDAEADRAFLCDVLKFPYVDVGHGWLIFGLPPAEVAVHPGEENDRHEFYLMCDDVEAVVAELSAAWDAVYAGAESGLGIAHADHAAGRRKGGRVSAAARASRAGEVISSARRRPMDSALWMLRECRPDLVNSCRTGS